ncbi:hypothetical protein CDAR_185191 [Caerostris darwini]|uniref:Uncharacterized protein n=1 Tax=Caerostris darwini TaxID=1538125 RepID=A0AAV4SQW1_9ARAC|nr:hypothetical protein CDAR_185191 [Caerostris darwini]
MEEITEWGTSGFRSLEGPEWRKSFPSGVSLLWLRMGKGGCQSHNRCCNYFITLLLGGWREREGRDGRNRGGGGGTSWLPFVRRSRMAAKFHVRRVVAMVTGWGKEGCVAGVPKPQQMLQLLYQSLCSEDGERCWLIAGGVGEGGG